jgi:hypothetical protein
MLGLPVAEFLALLHGGGRGAGGAGPASRGAPSTFT